MESNTVKVGTKMNLSVLSAFPMLHENTSTLQPKLFESMPAFNKANQIKKNKPFTKREKECIHYLQLGFSTKKIARELNLSPRTIEAYIFNITLKLGCSTRLEIVMLTMNLEL